MKKPSAMIQVAELMAITRILSPAEHGAFVRLIHSFWLLGPIDDDDEMLARITGTQIREWKKLRPAVQKHFVVADGFWSLADQSWWKR